ncbi:hypothetical protein NQ317_001030 [Molorchus minor]|uniref:Uncharacterized protein n=1 Tax=Molorchus minor TaxID=1323400 RepID=A0ABQ9JFW5_9CUCU|nr:hypothetical protein NQ317_001030 [Molorchus minor]
MPVGALALGVVVFNSDFCESFAFREPAIMTACRLCSGVTNTTAYPAQPGARPDVGPTLTDARWPTPIQNYAANFAFHKYIFPFGYAFGGIKRHRKFTLSAKSSQLTQSLASAAVRYRLHAQSFSTSPFRISPFYLSPFIMGAFRDVAGLVTLQNLQNLASLQQSLPQVASLAAGLSNMANLSGNSSVNAPLNLSIGASAATPRCTQSDQPPSIMATSINTSQPPSSASMQPPNPHIGSQQPAPLPQFILASGHLVQGIQGAQLLIPTSQGNKYYLWGIGIKNNIQLLFDLADVSKIIFSLSIPCDSLLKVLTKDSSLATQTILTIPVNHVNSSDQMVNLALNNGQVIQTSLANLQAMAQNNLLGNPNNSVPPTSNGTINPNLLNPAILSHLFSNGSAQQLLQTLPQMLINPHANPNPPSMLNHSTQPLLPATPSVLTAPTSQSTTQQQPQHKNQVSVGNHYAESKLHAQSIPRNSSPNNMGSSNRINTNGEISISTSHGHISCHNIKRSPSSLSPNCTDSSTADLLIDSPNGLLGTTVFLVRLKNGYKT